MTSSPPTTPYPRGTVLGSYRLEGVLGQGAVGTVYLATHTRLDRRVAIKLLQPKYAGDPAAVRRFFDEARTVSQVSHPNVIEVTDFVEQPGGDNYYVMELLEGGNLSELVQFGGRLELARTVAIMTQLAKALEAVHDADIVHRDVKPLNVVLIHREGNLDFVKLVDFGVALRGGKGRRDRADRGSIVGTPRYMSPEQARGADVDHRSDVYSFGAMFYELVTGRPPIVVSTNIPELVEQLRTVQPAPPASLPDLPERVPPALDALIMRCLAKSPDERPATMGKIADSLVAIADEESWLVYELSAMPSASAATLPARQSEPASAPRVSRWLVGAALIAIAAGAAAFVATRRPTAGAAVDAAAARRAKVEAELQIADQRIRSGRLGGSGDDEALAHLLAARQLDPKHAGVQQRLGMLAREFERLADAARAAGSLPEAATYLEAVLAIEPGNQAAAAHLEEVEQQQLAQQPRPGR